MSPELLIGVCFAAFGVLLIVRNHIVFKHHQRRLHEIHHRHNELIKLGRWQEVDFNDYDRLGDYDWQMLDLRKWTYRQFYGGQL